MGYISFFLIQKHLYVSCHQEGIHYCTTHKYRDSSWCFQTHPKIWSLLYFDIVSQLIVQGSKPTA